MWNACGRCGAARRLAKPIKNTVANDWLHVIYIYIRNNNERNGNRWSWPYLLPQGPFQLFTASNYLYEMYLHTPFERAGKKIVYVVSVFFFVLLSSARHSGRQLVRMSSTMIARARARTWKAKRKTLQERKGADSRRNREKRHTANHLYPVLIEPRYASSHNHFFFFYVLIHRQENIVFLAGTNESTTSTTTTIKMLFSIRLLRCYRLNEFLTNIDQSSSLFFFLSL